MVVLTQLGAGMQKAPESCFRGLVCKNPLLRYCSASGSTHTVDRFVAPLTVNRTCPSISA